MSNSKLKKITSARLFLPIVCLIAVLLINVIKTPDFFNITIRNGVLYGYVIDVINRASELVILAVGMTLVTAASGGQDISVGAVMAVAAAVCCQILSGGASSVTSYWQNSTCSCSYRSTSCISTVRCVQWTSGSEAEHSADGRNPDPLYSRTWYRTACHKWSDYLYPCGIFPDGRWIYR